MELVDLLKFDLNDLIVQNRCVDLKTAISRQ